MKKNKKERNIAQDNAVSRLFTTSIVKKLLKGKRPVLIDEVYDCLFRDGYITERQNLSGLYRAAYSYMLANYRNEYIFKNAIANNILLGRHNLNTTHMIQEFRIANCKADVLMLNGTSRVYEIKSDYDSFERLERQVSAYRQAVDEVYVIVGESQVDKALQVLSLDIGIIEFRKTGHIGKPIREAASLKHQASVDVIFDCLRKCEYKKILKDKLGEVPSVPNTLEYKEYKKLFSKLSRTEAHDAMVEVLKKRGEARELKDFILSVPKELRSFALGTKIPSSDRPKLLELLSSPV